MEGYKQETILLENVTIAFYVRRTHLNFQKDVRAQKGFQLMGVSKKEDNA